MALVIKLLQNMALNPTAPVFTQSIYSLGLSLGFEVLFWFEGLRVHGLWFRILGFQWFRVHDLGFRVVQGFRVYDCLGFRF